MTGVSVRRPYFETIATVQLYDLDAKMCAHMMHVPKRAVVHLLI